MGGFFSAIETEEKKLRLSEARNEIYDAIRNIDDFDKEWGQKELKSLTEDFEKTFEADSSDEEDGQSDQNVIYTKLPWESLETDE